MTTQQTRRAWLAAAAALFAADLFLHLPITDYCDALVKRFWFLPFDAMVRRAFIAIGVACVGSAWAWRRPRHTLAAPAMGVLVAVVAAAQMTIVLNAIEDVHYPQYALMAAVLARGVPSLEAAWLGATGLGAADELYQFLELPRGTPSYYDWNDVVLNAIGASFGIVFVLLLSRESSARPISTRVAAAVAPVAIVCACVASPPSMPFYTVTPGGRLFHKMAASEAAIALAALWWGVRYLVDRPSAAPAPTVPAI